MASLIKKNFNENKSVFACCIDFFSAFDFLNRDLLFFVLEEIGINKEFLALMKAQYTDTESCVKLNDKITNWLRTYSGVKQDQNDWATLFAIYANSLSENVKYLQKGIKIGNVLISLLMYADDIILISEKEQDLQHLIDEVYNWCKKWRMIVNTDKTQIVQFRLKKVQKTNFKFHLGGNELLVVNNYKYLGVIFDQFMDKHANGNGFADCASRALGNYFLTIIQTKVWPLIPTQSYMKLVSAL